MESAPTPTAPSPRQDQSRQDRLATVLAGLYGAAGVGLMAAGSHTAGGSFAATAGQMLLFHAPAVLAAILARRAGLLHARLGRIAVAVLLGGVAVFAADLALRGFGHARLFPMAAPAGGSLTILGWLLLAASAALPRRDP